MSKYSDNKDAIEEAIEKTKLLVDNPRLDPSLGRILVAELLFGAGKLTGQNAKPVACVLSYKDKLQEAIGGAPAKSSKSARGIIRLDSLVRLYAG